MEVPHDLGDHTVKRYVRPVLRRSHMGGGRAPEVHWEGRGSKYCIVEPGLGVERARSSNRTQITMCITKRGVRYRG